MVESMLPADGRGLLHTAQTPGPMCRFFGQLFLTVAIPMSMGAFYSPPTASAVAALVGVVCLFLAPRQVVLRAPIPLTALLLSAWLAASLSWSQSPADTFLVIKTEVPLIIVAIGVAGVLTVEDIAAAVVRAARIVVAVALVYALIDPASRQVEGWTAGFISKNALGMALIILLAAVLALDRSRVGRLVTLAGIAVLLVGSRAVGAWGVACLIVALAIWLAVLHRGDARSRGAVVVSSVVLGTTAIAAIGFALAAVVELVGKDLTFSGRLQIWSATWDAVLERPVLGFGRRGLFETGTPRVRELYTDVGFEPATAHNGLLGLLIDLGIPGLVLVVAMIVGILVGGIRLFHVDSRFSNWFVLSAVCILQMGISEDAFLAPYIVVITVLLTASMRPALSVDASRDPIPPRQLATVGGTR